MTVIPMMIIKSPAALRTGGLYFLFLLLSVTTRGQEHPPAKKTVRIIDENGFLTPARIRVMLNDSTYIAPDGHEADFPFTNYGADVISISRLFHLRRKQRIRRLTY
jgi:hypothetical protein